MSLGAVTTLVFDLDGVVWRGNSPIEGAVEAIMQLKASGKRCLYCTNNSSQTPAAFVEKLAGMGVEAVEDDIITSSTATALYLSAQYTGPFLAYVIGGEGVHSAIQKIGARIVYDRDIDDTTNVDCVVAGIDRSFTYDKLNTAQRLIRSGALFVATNRDATYPVEHGVIPGAGSIVASIETASGTTPVTIGKPRPVMVQLIQQKYKLQPQEIAFIGDRLDTDVVCARRAGVTAILVLTGVTTLAQARRAKGELRPDAVFPDLPSLVGVVLDNSPAAPLNDDELPTYSGTTAPAEPVTQGAPRGEAESFPVAEEPQLEPPAASAAAAAATSTEPAAEPEAEIADAVPVESESTEAASGFSFAGDLATPEEPAAQADASDVSESTPEPSSAATDEPEVAPKEIADAAAPADAAAGGEWDDNWFAEEQSTNGESTPAGDAEEPKEEEPAATTASGGFEWKLD
jgi:4-nitrophenyl phosphatase